MLKVLIIEDEIPAQQNLIRTLNKLFDDVVVVGRIDSVSGAVEWLKDSVNSADIIFMDAELSDGKCFEIFRQVTPKGCVVITTAYDHYAIEAFKNGSTDYLLKPVVKEELITAVERCRERISRVATQHTQQEQIEGTKHYKRRFTVKVGDKILIIPAEDIAYFYSEDKAINMVTHLGSRYIVDQSLDMLVKLLDPTMFFRVSRGCISSVGAIKTISKHFSSRLKVTLKPSLDHELYVSRNNISDFIDWIEGGGQ